ncbi:unnamed protein product, partial [Meganyctiphanes norvegica]
CPPRCSLPLTMKVVCILFLLSVVSLVRTDTPANCMYEDILGTWTFLETARTDDNSISCDEGELGDTVYTKTFTLLYPNTVTDELGNQGTWTLIYNQGFEVNINGRSYFTFSYYEGNYITSTSYCDQTFPGWARDDTMRNWSCFTTQKNAKVAPRVTTRRAMKGGDKMYKNDHELISRINKSQSSWVAKAYPEFEIYTQMEMTKRAGGPWASPLTVLPKKKSPELKKRVSMLPKSFDWRNVEGVSYVSDIRDQRSCGSCYAFASMANLEAQIRIATKNERQDVFSPQDIVDCTYLAQGCNGGFDYLIAGRYAMEQGVVAEECNLYNGADGECSTDNTCSRTYVSKYQHVGGYYGACNEEEMLVALVEGGPVSVSFMVYNDFHNYGGGIYHHTEFKSDFNPFEVTNHVVLIVGYGEDESTGEKFWIVKNSWGSSWGEEGYFRIRRGTDEVAIESMAVQVTIIP